MESYRLLIALCSAVLLVSCSTTKNIPDDDQLFVGLRKISYDDGGGDKTETEAANLLETQTEVEAALATAPNGALFGSSYYRSPFSPGLWVWNTYSGKDSKFAKWMTHSFGQQPVLMSWVNPTLRAQVAQSVLKNHGYFQGTVGYDVLQQRNPKKAKIGYHVNLGPLTLVDSMEYAGFTATHDSLIHATLSSAKLKKGSPFTVSALDAERNRLSVLFRNNGYYYYQTGYATYLADTTGQDHRAHVRLQLANGLPPEALRPWYIGKVRVNMRKKFNEPLTDSVSRRSLAIHYNGSKPALRPRVLLGGMRLRSRQPYSYEKYQETLSNISAMGLFSMTEFTFTPRDTTALCDTLDMTVDCTLERPYDVYWETNVKKSNLGRLGPELKIGFTRRNAFRGGEKLDINLHGSYEWQLSGGGSNRNTYEFGADVSLTFPRLVAPWLGGNRVRRDKQGRPVLRRRYYATPSTMAKFSQNRISRPGFYRMNVVSGEWTYHWQPTEKSQHTFSPLTVKYQHINHATKEFEELVYNNGYLMASMQDYLIPQMRYTYAYSSSANSRHPFRWETTITESGNVTSLGYLIAGRRWNEKDKLMFKTPYAQFLRVETDYVKTWPLTPTSQLVGHLNAGVLWYFGNSESGPFSEMFYAGGASSVRAFPTRSIGPGSFQALADRQYAYLMQNGDIKFVANLEYRTRLFGNLYGAAFLDAGNVWNLDEDYEDSGDEITDAIIRYLIKDTSLKPRKFLDQLALGTGIGLRYDLDFLVLRLDWGFGLHLPYDTGHGGYFNISRFKDMHTLHLAIGYPF